MIDFKKFSSHIFPMICKNYINKLKYGKCWKISNFSLSGLGLGNLGYGGKRWKISKIWVSTNAIEKRDFANLCHRCRRSRYRWKYRDVRCSWCWYTSTNKIPGFWVFKIIPRRMSNTGFLEIDQSQALQDQTFHFSGDQ